jgi:hypothetical protein
VIVASFDFLSFTHIYIELNDEANKLSKEGLLLQFGCWMVEEFNEAFLSSSQGRF